MEVWFGGGVGGRAMVGAASRPVVDATWEAAELIVRPAAEVTFLTAAGSLGAGG